MEILESSPFSRRSAAIQRLLIESVEVLAGVDWYRELSESSPNLRSLFRFGDIRNEDAKSLLPQQTIRFDDTSMDCVSSVKTPARGL